MWPLERDEFELPVPVLELLPLSARRTSPRRWPPFAKVAEPAQHGRSAVASAVRQGDLGPRFRECVISLGLRRLFVTQLYRQRSNAMPFFDAVRRGVDPWDAAVKSLGSYGSPLAVGCPTCVFP